ncbi:DMT family transporter [Phytohalomonas tamaricis]|uniref:DMT family transporter n=1 Tax=Phytohalomonas tamaricis TaxID=2081032 RepID=UPI0021D42A42|nr:DMT family transporter [Phytohalomonas tamaricis]
MSSWIFFTLGAAFMQAWRNAFQKQLSLDVGALGVTLARFLWAWPLAGGYLLILHAWQPVSLPHFSALFAFDIVAGALSQIIATMLMVRLFQRRSYAAGVGLAKSEALLAAILGVMFFGASLSPLGWLGVIIGAAAIWLMKGSRTPGIADGSTIVIGLASGMFFALTTLWVRHASHQLTDLPFLHASAWVLFFTITTQLVVLLTWLGWRDRTTLVRVYRRPKLVFCISLASCLASIGWFTAVNLEHVALVKTLGQIEVFFTLLISHHWLREKITGRDRWGLLLIVISALCVMWT